jgi:hypothetical protein
MYDTAWMQQTKKVTTEKTKVAQSTEENCFPRMIDNVTEWRGQNGSHFLIVCIRRQTQQDTRCPAVSIFSEDFFLTLSYTLNSLIFFVSFT